MLKNLAAPKVAEEVDAAEEQLYKETMEAAGKRLAARISSKKIKPGN